MRQALILVLLAACSDPPDLLTFTVGAACDPPVPAATLPVVGSTAPRAESRPVSWACEEGCEGFDDSHPLAVFQSHDLAFVEEDLGFRVDTFAVWSISNDPPYAFEVEESAGCWYRHRGPATCASDFFLCESAGRWTASITVRDPVLGADQRWEMRE